MFLFAPQSNFYVRHTGLTAGQPVLSVPKGRYDDLTDNLGSNLQIGK